MYAEWPNQLQHMGNFLLAFLLVTAAIPRLIFSSGGEGGAYRLVSNGCKGVLLVILIGYLLVIVKLYEMIALLLIFIGLAVRSSMRRRKGRRGPEDGVHRYQKTVFGILDGHIAVGTVLGEWLARKGAALKRRLEPYKAPAAWSRLAALGFVVLVSAYYRFYDAVTTSAPALSDGYVTLAWMKYIDQRVLFHDGIYPQGFHIYLATLGKFAMIDALYILKYTGPLNGVLTALGLFYAVYRLTRHYWAGLAAAIVFGWMGFLYTGFGWERQAATNSQEFAFVFIFPAIAFAFQYFRTKEKGALRDTFVCLTIMGLVHTLAYGFAALAVAAVMAAFLLTAPRDAWRRFVHMAVAGIASGIVSVIPLGIGVLLGKEMHSSSASYMVSVVENLTRPELRAVDYISVACIAFAGLVSLALAFVRGRGKSGLQLALFTFLFGGGTFALHYYVGVWLQSELITTRSHLLWFLAAPFAIGWAWYAFTGWMAKWRTWHAGLNWAATIGFIVFVLLVVKPEPVHSYKMEWDSGVEQYLRISSELRPKTWAIFSQEEGYALVLGEGFHFYIADLLEDYDPSKPFLTKWNEAEPDKNIPNDIFIYLEKDVFRVEESNTIYSLLEATYERREAEMTKLREWLRTHQKEQQDMKLYYEDDNLAVYWLHREPTREEVYELIWGKPKPGKGAE